MAHSLNPKYYSDEWLHEDQNRVPPHRDEEVTRERNKCFKRYFEDITERTKVITEFGKFSGYIEAFSEYDSIHNRWHMDPYTWWCAYGAYAPSLQKLALRLLVQKSSFDSLSMFSLLFFMQKSVYILILENIIQTRLHQISTKIKQKKPLEPNWYWFSHESENQMRWDLCSTDTSLKTVYGCPTPVGHVSDTLPNVSPFFF